MPYGDKNFRGSLVFDFRKLKTSDLFKAAKFASLEVEDYFPIVVWIAFNTLQTAFNCI